MDSDYMVERLRALLRWREHLDVLKQAIKEAAPGCKAYIIGGAAEGRLTAKSDIDVLIVCKTPPKTAYEVAEITSRIRGFLEESGVEWAYLYELHVVGEEASSKYLGRGRTAIRIL